jgi:hypothetical protein
MYGRINDVFKKGVCIVFFVSEKKQKFLKISRKEKMKGIEKN